jgi:hypothetical protein
MNRRLTALFAAFEALLVLGVGIAIPLLPLTALWAFQYGLAIDWTTFWRASVDIWLVGHGVDLRLTLDPLAAAALGYPGADAPVTITIALLGFALLTVLLGVRAGRRIAETRTRLLGELVSLATFAAISFLVTYSALHPMARPSLWQGTLLPTVVFAVGLAIGVRSEADDAGGRLRAWFESWPRTAHLVAVTALRGGAAAAAAVMAAAALATTGAIVVAYARIITLYESLHGELLGGIAITLGQLALLPNLVIWSASWLVGPGFAIGTGSLVSPLGTQLGPLPALPVLGALPSGEFAFGFVGLLVPLVVGFLVGAVLTQRLRGRLDGGPMILTGLGTGLVGGVLLGLLAWASAGSAGPGRLADVGPDPWAVGVAAAIEIAVACTFGMLVARRRRPAGARSGR